MSSLDDSERDVIRDVLRATIDGPFFPDWEFATLFGYERERVQSVLDAWPEGIGTEETDEVIQGALGQMIGYPHGEWEVWATFSRASIDDLKAVARHYAADLAGRASVQQTG